MALNRLRGSTEVLNITASVIRVVGRGGWTLVVPWILSVGGFASYTIWQASAGIVAQLSILGVTQTVMRERNHDLPVAGIVLHTVFLAALWTFIWSITMRGHDATFYLLVLLGAVGTSLYMLMGARAKGRLAFSRVIVAEMAAAGALLCSSLILGLAAASGVGWAVKFTLAIAAEILAIVMALTCLAGGRLRLSSDEAKFAGLGKLLPAIYSIGVLGCLDIILWRRIELYFLRASADGIVGVAVFGLATQVGNLFMLFPSAVTEAWYPAIAASYLEGPEVYARDLELKIRRFTKLYGCFLFAGAPACLILMRLLYVKYSMFYSYMAALVLIRALCGYSGFYAGVLYSTRRERMLYLPIVVGGCISLACNWSLTIRYGLNGVMVSYLATQLFVAISTYGVWKISEARRNPVLFQKA